MRYTNADKMSEHQVVFEAQVAQEEHGQVSEITHKRCKYLKLHVAVKKKTTPRTKRKGAYNET